MLNNLSSEERKTLIVWALIGLIIFVIAIMFKIFIVNKESLKEYNDPYTIERDYSRYYTVTTALTKYYSFINSKNYKSVLNILDTKFKESKNINEDNILEYITNSDISLSFKSGKMCYKEIDNGITSYLVEGYEVGMNTGKKMDKKYYEIVLDGNKLLYSVKPINKKTYGGNCNG